MYYSIKQEDNIYLKCTHSRHIRVDFRVIMDEFIIHRASENE